ncbi:hypothetical protein EBO34_07420 [Alteribacter keqinensis]|uniref:Uncharacterized protein n=1 Tax=Alteribacter keqinensis TaxID=2483800 RepID=A0A3M7TVW2_9BACI|nr:hypothetical protein EBO34_07420 [Alteribacter keqinensis]
MQLNFFTLFYIFLLPYQFGYLKVKLLEAGLIRFQKTTMWLEDHLHWMGKQQKKFREITRSG